MADTSLPVAIDIENDVIILYGIKYSLGVFRTLALGPVGRRRTRAQPNG